MYSANAVADFLLALARENGEILTPMKLQKMLYFGHGWHLATRGTPLFREHIEAWEFGPVVSPVYHRFKDYGDAPIVESVVPLSRSRVAADHVTVGVLTRVWEEYGKYSPIALSNMTHDPDGPWAQTYYANPNAKHLVIDNDVIRRYFVNVAQTGAAQG